MKKCILKIVAAALTALAVLNLFCAWYYNPTAYEWDEIRATDTIRTPGAFTSRATEGTAWAFMDENGYNNASVPGEEGVSVLMMGSSHTEALNVAQHESASTLLDEMLRADGHAGSVYNIGMSSHMFARNAANLPRALKRFQPTEYVVIETSELVFPYYTVLGAIQHNLERLTATEVALPSIITDRPLTRALYRQFSTWFGPEEASSYGNLDMVSDDVFQDYENILTDLFAQMKSETSEYGAELIIYYHPHLILQEDGSARTDVDVRCLNAFAAAATRAEVTFLDMSEAFLSAYASDHILPHGFANTAPGAGHLNADGHALIARELYKIIAGEEIAA